MTLGNQPPHDPGHLADADEVDLLCPGCNADLAMDEIFQAWSVCGACGRHFWISARDRIAMLAGDQPIDEPPYVLPALDPLTYHDRLPAPDRLSDVRDRGALENAVVVARLDLGGTRSLVVALDSVLLSGGLGIVAGDKVLSAFERAASESLPLVVVCGGGSGPVTDGVLAAFQPARIAGALQQLHRTGQPMIAVVTHPTGSSIRTGLASFADILLLETGAAKDSLRPDATIPRRELASRLGSILGALGRRPAYASGAKAPTLTLAESTSHAEVRLERAGGRNVVRLSLEATGLSLLSIPVLVRGQRLSHTLDLPLVIHLSSTSCSPAGEPAMIPTIADGLLRHRAPVVVVLDGTFDGSVAPLFTGDATIATAASGFCPAGTRGRTYPAADCLRLSLFDAVVGDIGEQAGAAELERLLDRTLGELERYSPGRRIDRRIAATIRRGAETPARSEATWRELHDLSDLQGAIGRSLDDMRGRLERRQRKLPQVASFPAFQELQHRAALMQLNMPKFQERGTALRDRLTTRRPRPEE